MSSSHPSRGLEWYVARRYLSSKGGGRLFSFITWIALGGVTVGVSALVIVIGVMSGMQEDLMGKILESSPHVLVLQQGTSIRMDDWKTMADRVRKIEGVEAVAPFVLTTVTALHRTYSQSADMYGVALDPEGPAVTEMEGRIQEGAHDLGPTASGLPPVLMGSRLAARMQALIGDTLTLIAFENLTVDPMGMPSPSIRLYEVTGTFTTGMYDYDIKNIYVPIEAAQEQLGILAGDRVGGLGVRVRDPDEAGPLSDSIQAALGYEFMAISWSTTNGALFSALELEKLAMYLILTLIVVVARVQHREHSGDGRGGSYPRNRHSQIHGYDRPDDSPNLHDPGSLHRGHRYDRGYDSRIGYRLGLGHLRDHQDSRRCVLR